MVKFDACKDERLELILQNKYLDSLNVECARKLNKKTVWYRKQSTAFTVGVLVSSIFFLSLK